jgi:hypothetical protein
MKPPLLSKNGKSLFCRLGLIFFVVGVLANRPSAGNTYEIIYGVFDWPEAVIDAENRGGHLATITSEEEWHSISSSLGLPKVEQYWIGASDEAAEGIWKWVTGEPWSYTRWAPGEPSGTGLYGEEDVLMLYGYLDGQWNDAQWYHLGFGSDGYILEIESSNSVPETANTLALLTGSCLLLFALKAINLAQRKLGGVPTTLA